MRNTFVYPNPNFSLESLLNFSKLYKYSSILLSNNTEDKFSIFQTIFSFGEKDFLVSENDSFNKLRHFQNKYNDWMFGFLSYDLKNEIENLTSENVDKFKDPNLLFYIPETIFFISDNELRVESYLTKIEIDKIINQIQSQSVHFTNNPKIDLQFRETKQEYVQKINQIKGHIQKGDIYEMNYCQEMYSEGTSIDPAKVFLDLNQSSMAPFSVYFKYDKKYLLCSSPERFLQKQKDVIISQPIKGTRKRGGSKKEDFQLKEQLTQCQKEKSENVMITDLVRNDLSKTALRSSVKVNELCGIYTFERVHQMISTISSRLDDEFDFVDVLETTFPMGSMTGAPKIKSMQLIEKYETIKRSIYSGAFGYISPNKDFDFNVVIRSILYNEIDSYVSVMVGGAITINSDPIEEYEECMVKAKAMIEVLRNER